VGFRRLTEGIQRKGGGGGGGGEEEEEEEEGEGDEEREGEGAGWPAQVELRSGRVEAPAIGQVVLIIVADQVAQREPVVRCDEVDAVLRLAPARRV